jgi:hypothetical protein
LSSVARLIYRRWKINRSADEKIARPTDDSDAVAA